MIELNNCVSNWIDIAIIQFFLLQCNTACKLNVTQYFIRQIGALSYRNLPINDPSAINVNDQIQIKIVLIAPIKGTAPGSNIRHEAAIGTIKTIPDKYR